MSKCNLYFLLLAGTVYSSPVMAVYPLDNTSTQTHTNQLELKPAFLSDSFKTASVCFMGFGDCDPNIGFGKGDDYAVDSAQQCLTEGYTKQNCNSLQMIDGVCPYDSAYGKGCKCKTGLVTCSTGQTGIGASCNGQYASCSCSSSLVSCASNQNGVGASCGGKYESCTCKSEYLYNSYNCSSPRSLSGNTCGGKYTGCSCPSGVSAGSFGCAEYYPSPCSGVCKAPNGDNCNARISVNAPYGCMTYWSDCSSKCQTAYPDNCRSRTAVIASCPTNATCSYFGDCSAKISDWTCNSGYSKSGNSCVINDPCAGYYDCGGKWQYCEGTTCRTDSSKCSTFCVEDFFPSGCVSASECASNGGIYREGYCSAPCPSATPTPTPTPSSSPSPEGSSGLTESQCSARYPDYDECADRGPCTCDRRTESMPGECSDYYRSVYLCASW